MRVRREWRIGLSAAALVGALGVAVMRAAFAQPAVPTFPECTKKASKDDIEAAKNAHRVAKEFYDRADYDKAIQYWSDAYKFDCSANDLLINIANAYEKKGDRAATIATLEAYLKRTGPNPTIEEKVKNLKALMAPPPPQPTAQPSATAQPTTSVPVPPPTATTVPTAPAPEGVRPYGAKPWILVGGGGAIAIAGAILLPIGLGNLASADAACPNRMCGKNTSAAGQGNAGRAESVAGGVLLGAGVALAIGGLAWQFGGNKPGPASQALRGASLASQAPPAGSLWLKPMAGRGASGLVAGGSF
jgi:hypothetical protein